MRDGQLLEKQEIDKIRHIPTIVIQGRYDVVCPVSFLYGYPTLCHINSHFLGNHRLRFEEGTDSHTLFDLLALIYGSWSIRSSLNLPSKLFPMRVILPVNLAYLNSLWR